MTNVGVKICGLKTPADVAAVAKAGARYAGFNFFAKSPRSVVFETARDLAALAPPALVKVALVVDVDDDFLDALTAAVPLDMLQLHGRESSERVREVKARYRLPVMKVLGIAAADDLAKINDYGGIADQLLLDAKPPKDAVLPGGNGLVFDWTLLANQTNWPCPWMLAGGLNPGNVAEAMRLTGANQVDVASGVESAPGEKDAGLIDQFCRNASAAAD